MLHEMNFNEINVIFIEQINKIPSKLQMELLCFPIELGSEQQFEALGRNKQNSYWRGFGCFHTKRVE